MRTTLLISTLLWLSTSVSFAQMTAKDGLKQIETNIENSKLNIEEYKKNLGIVENNLVEVGKTKDKLTSQRTDLKKVQTENSKFLSDYQKRQAELDKMIADENKSQAQEALKIKELETWLATLKQNQEARTKNIQGYQDQKVKLAQDQKDWELRSQNLNKMAVDLESQLNQVKTEENSWKGKKKGYEGEISRWTKELEKQEKLSTEAKALMEAKQ